jgi:hypothetical protein
MLSEFLSFVLRLLLIVVLWTLVWQLIEPKTQLRRILRAAVLVLCLLGAMLVMRYSAI